MAAASWPPPAVDTEVSSDLAESYGYKDDVPQSKNVSALDVLVKAHALRFEDDFTQETAREILEVDDNGRVNLMFGKDASLSCFLVNGAAPGNATVNQAKVVTGDDVLFGFYQDTGSWSDQYSWLETADGQKLDGQSIHAGSKLSVKALSRAIFGSNTGTPLTGATVGLVDVESGLVEELGTTDDTGCCEITIPKELANSTCYLTVNGTYTFMSLSKVQVGEAVAENALTSLQIALGADEDSLNELTLSPSFRGDVTEYTTPIQDYIATAKNRYVWVKVTASEGTTVSYTSGSGFWATTTTIEPGKWVDMNRLENGTFNEVVLDLKKDGAEDISYTITVPIQPDTSNQSLTWKTNLKEKAYFRPDSQAALTVQAQHNNRPLDCTAEITYQWYSAQSAEAEDGTLIQGATGPTYNPDTSKTGWSYYYAVASCEGFEGIRSKTIAVKITDEKAPTSITITCDYPYFVEDTWVKALEGKKFIASEGDVLHIRAVDENGNDTPVEWSCSVYGGTFDTATGDFTVTYGGNTYLTATSLVDPTVTTEEKAVQIQSYKFSQYQKNQTVSLSTDGQKVSTASISGSVDGHTSWILDIPQGVAECTSDLSKKSGSLSFKVYRPGTIGITTELDLGGENDPKLRDTATITVTGVGVEATDGARGRVDLEITAGAPNPTASLTTFLMDGRTVASWTSSNEAAATVDENGVVTAKSIGTAVITATDDQGTKGGIKVVVTDAAKPTMENVVFTSGFNGVSGLTFDPATFNYTGLTVRAATSKVEFANTTAYSSKLQAVASYTDENGQEQTVAVASGATTNLVPNIAFGTSTLTLTLTRTDNPEIKSVYTFELTRPRDSTAAVLKYNGGLNLLAEDGSALGTDLYRDKAEGFLFKADEQGDFVGGNTAFTNNVYLYRAYMQNGRKAFTLSTTANSTYSHLRYSIDDGETWTELAQGGGRTEAISFPKVTNANAVVKVIVQLVNDKTYVENDGFPETVTQPSNGYIYTVWVEQLPSADSLQILTATTGTGDWYPAFDPNHTSYAIYVPAGADIPALSYTVAAGLTVTVNDATQTPNEEGVYTLALSSASQTVTLESSDGYIKRNYTFRCNERLANSADKLIDHLAINSQYTNVSYGVNPEAILAGNLKSLGNFGGYATFYFAQGLRNDPANKYGVDFYVDGNAFVDTTTGTGLGSMEPGQVWVSEDGSTWYALAGSEHYDGAIWDYTVTYTRDGDGTSWSDNYGNTNVSANNRTFKWPLVSSYPLNELVKKDTITLSGILIPSNKGIVGSDEFSTTSSGAKFGYVDTLQNGTDNPYGANDDYKVENSGFDLAWAVDAAGNPVDVSGKEFHYVKVVTASNIVAGAINEKSTEVSGIRRAEPAGSAVGTTPAPTGITLSGDSFSYTLTPEAGKQVYTLTLPVNSASIQVNGSAENIYINNQRVSAGSADKTIDIAKDNTLVRVIVQSGDMEPTIVLLKLSYVEASEEDFPVITTQPASAEYAFGAQAAALSVEAQPEGSLSYQWFVTATAPVEGEPIADAQPIADATASTLELGRLTEAGSKYYFCTITSTKINTYSVSSDVAAITVKTLDDTLVDVLTGAGTQEDPYQITSAEDYVLIGQAVAAGHSFAGQYLAQTADVTLPADWQPIGVLIDPSVGHINGGKNMAPFSGHLDGGGYTLTVPEGGLPLLGYVTDAYVSNLNIYGTQIAGYGLVNNLEGVGLKGNAITIDGVTLKSGTQTLKAGLIGTYLTSSPYSGCTGTYLVTIRNCVAEEGVVIGYDETQSHIGSFAGRFQGTIENCVSYATVKGVSYVGGIVGSLDNAMSTYVFRNCTFAGKVEASGELVGGILGGGYSDSSAPNAKRATIQNCTVTGAVTGKDKIGGIQGGNDMVYQTYSNGPLYIQNNTFSGEVTAYDGNRVGAVIGFLRGLDRHDYISGNIFYSLTLNPIGEVDYVDTSAEEHENTIGKHYINSANGVAGIPKPEGVSKWFYWTKNLNRTDDLLGAGSVSMGDNPSAKLAEGTETALFSGQTATLKVLTFKTDELITGESLSWALENPDDAAHAAIAADGTVKALAVSADTDVTFVCTLSGDYSGTLKHTITIKPTVKMAADAVTTVRSGHEIVPLVVSIATGDYIPMEKVSWALKNPEDAAFAGISENGQAVVALPVAESRKVTFVGTVTGDICGVVEHTITIVPSVKMAENAPAQLLSGKSVTLRAVDAETGKAIPAASISWALKNPDDAAYVTVTTKGTVKAFTAASSHEVTIVGTLTNGWGIVEHTITVYPVTTLVQIWSNYADATGKTLYLNAAENETLSLSAKLFPADSMEGVTWKSSNPKIASVDKDGTVKYVGKTGTVTITATANDGSKKAASVKIQVGILTTKVEIAELGSNSLRSGKSLTLKAVTTPEKPTVAGVTFRLVNSTDSAYATVTAAGKVTAKAVNEPHAVQIIAVSKDAAKIQSEPVTLTILPKSDQSLILKVGDDYVTKTTLYRNAEDKVQLNAFTLDVSGEKPTEEKAENVTWKSSKPKVAAVDENGEVTCLTKGAATISALVNGKVQATVTISVTSLVKKLDITSKTGALTVASGKTLNLIATVLEPEKPANKAVTWSITEGAEFAKLSAKGVLTASKNLTAPAIVTVKATAKDGSDVSATQDITVLPLAYGVEILRGKASQNNTTLVWDMAKKDNEALELSAAVYPNNAAQSVIWKSSSAKIATVDGNGVVTFKKAGTVTITATAADGSGRKASFKIQVVKLMKSLTLADAVIAGGKSLTLKPVIDPIDTTNKKLAWSVSGNDAKITINASGKLSTKAVKEPVTVTVTVKALDGSGTNTSCQVTVYPATTKVVISAKEDNLPATLNVGSTLALTASSQPETAANAYTWKSSSTKIATVDAKGVVTAVKAGTVKITCTAADGTGKFASITLKVVQAPAPTIPPATEAPAEKPAE